MLVHFMNYINMKFTTIDTKNSLSGIISNRGEIINSTFPLIILIIVGLEICCQVTKEQLLLYSRNIAMEKLYNICN